MAKPRQTAAPGPPKTIALRDYQREALQAVLEAEIRGRRRQLLVLPTGSGKTVVIGALVERVWDPKASARVLVLAHLDELLHQAAATLTRMVFKVKIGIEQGKRYAGDAGCVLASIGTLQGPRLKDFLDRTTGGIRVLVVDEAHRSAAKSYRTVIDEILQRNPQALLVGITATPFRTDKKALGTIYEEIVYQRTLNDAIEGGYLVPVRGYRISTKASIGNVGRDAEGEDFAAAQLARAVDTDERNRLIVKAYLMAFKGRRTLVFAVNVKHAERLAIAFAKAGIRSASVSAKTPMKERTQLLKAFREGDLQVLTNCSLLTEGADVPYTELVIMARPTESGVLYSQAIGRGTRPHPSIASKLGHLQDAEARRILIASSPKPAVAILDVVDADSGNNIVTVPTLFGLPPDLDARGRDLASLVHDPDAVRGLLEAKAELIPFETAAPSVRADDTASPAEDVEQLTFAGVTETALTIVADAAPPKVIGNGLLRWKSQPDGYMLALPTYETASDSTGIAIVRFESTRRAIEREAQATGQPPRETALERLEVDETTLASHHLEYRLTREDAVWTVRQVLDGSSTVVASAEQLEDAVARAESFIQEHFPWVFEDLRPGQSWKLRTTTPTQRRRLQSLGVKDENIPESYDDASALAFALLHQRAAS